MPTTITIYPPTHFLSLQKSGYRCLNYYWGDGGKKIGITPEFLKSVGLHDDTLWVHTDVLSHLKEAGQKIEERGFSILIKDAWRPSKLYDQIVSKHREKESAEIRLFEVKTKPHATGMAIDVVLFDRGANQDVWLRNEQNHGIASRLMGFYRDRTDPESVEFQRRQDILTSAFLTSGFKLGSRKEYWHFELLGIENAPRF